MPSGVYQWFRGTWGPTAVQCALITLESWAFERVAAGQEIDEVIRDVVSDNACCAVLGIAVGLAATQKHVAPSTLPLATSQRLWSWDVQRCVQDLKGLQSNLIRFAMTGEDSAHSNAVRDSNNKEYRKIDIRSLAMLFTITGDDKLRTACRAALDRFPTELPFDFEFWKNDTRLTAELHRTAEIWCKIGRIETYAIARTEDGSLLIKHQNPHSGDKDVVEAARRVANASDGDKIVFHALVYRSEPVAIVKEGLPARAIGMTWRAATSPIALAMRDLGEITKLSFWGRGVKMCRSGGV